MMSTTGIRLEELFDRDRCETGWDELSLVFYFPFGLCLVVIRIIIGLLLCIIATLLPRLSAVRCIILRVLYAVLGIIVKEEGIHYRDPKAKVIISNHVSVFDHLAIDILTPSILSVSWELPEYFKYILGLRKLERTEFNDDSSHHQDNFILIFPEETTTNGRRGLLKFAPWSFLPVQYIQPIIIKVYRPAGVNIAPSIVGSSWCSDLFWIFFVPFTTFEIRYLPIMIKKDHQSAEDFRLIVQTLMAQELDVVPTSFTATDKLEYARKLLTSQSSQQSTIPLRSSPTSSHQSTNLNTMSHQVKEVLPYVPLNVIEQDLEITGNVNVTITRILEGNVLYIPESPPTNTSKSVEPSTSQPFSRNSLSSTASKTFGKTPKERMLSYQERKAQLINNARRRYLQKHAAI